MRIIKVFTWNILLLFAGVIVFTSCEKMEEEIPTKDKMEGVWTVTEAYNELDQNILNKINFPITAFHLSSDNTVISTAGPMVMYIVYGDNKYTQIASTIDQVFNYANLDFNGGEFFVGGGEQSRFTLEMKLEGLPGQKALTELLELIGIGNAYLDVVVYHKFRDVKVFFEDNGNTMIWEWDNITTAVYNTKDNYGDYVLWGGWPVNNFSKCQFVLRKQSQGLNDVVQAAI